MHSRNVRQVLHSCLLLTVAMLVGPVSIAATPGTIEARLYAMDLSTGSVSIERLSDEARYIVSYEDTVKKNFSEVGLDRAVELAVDDVKEPTRITKIGDVSYGVSHADRLIALGCAFAFLFLVTCLVTKGNPLEFLIGLDNRYSNSQTQMVLWFGALATVYVAAVALRIHYLGFDYVGGVGIAQNVIALTGLSALSFGGAKLISSQKGPPPQKPGNSAPVEEVVTPPALTKGESECKPKPKPKPKPKTWADHHDLLRDLFQNDEGQADFGDFQMLLVTLATVTVFLVSCFVYLGDLWPRHTIKLPDVDTALLSAFGLGQGAYLAKKAASDPGKG